jgi:HEPN domain-containing protein
MIKRRSIKDPLLLAGLAFILAFFAIVGSASGQGHDDIQAALEKTDNLLEQARDIIREAGSDRGTVGMRSAEELQKQAWDAYHHGQRGRALQFTERARDEIYRALGSIRQSEDNDNEVERQLERTDAVLSEARDRLGPGKARMPTQRLDGAFNQQRRAWDLYRERRLRPALKLTLQARESVLRLGGGASGNRQGMDADPRAMEARLERLTEATDRVGERVSQGDNSRAEEIWKRATENLKNAEEALNAGDTRRADHLLRQVREGLDRAMRLVLREVRTDEVGVLIEAATERWELLQPVVSDADENRLRNWHEQAGESLERANQAVSDGNLRRALVQTRRAVELLDKIENELGD